MAIYDALTFRNAWLTTVEVDKAKDEEEAHEIARRKTWKYLCKRHPTAVPMIRKHGFWISHRADGLWGESDFYG